MTNSPEAAPLGLPTAPARRAGRKGNSAGTATGLSTQAGPHKAPLSPKTQGAAATPKAGAAHTHSGPAHGPNSGFAHALNQASHTAPAEAQSTVATAATAATAAEAVKTLKADSASQKTNPRLSHSDEDSAAAEALAGTTGLGLPINTAWPSNPSLVGTASTPSASADVVPAGRNALLSAQSATAIAPAGAGPTQPDLHAAPRTEPLPGAGLKTTDLPSPTHAAEAAASALSPLNAQGQASSVHSALPDFAKADVLQAVGLAVPRSALRPITGTAVASTPAASAASLTPLSAQASPLAVDGLAQAILPQQPRSAQQLKAEAAPSVLSAWASDPRMAKPLTARSNSTDVPTASAASAGHEALNAALLNPSSASPLSNPFSAVSGRDVLQGHIDTPTSSPEFHSSLASSVRGLMRQGGQAQFSLNPVEMGPITVKVDLQGDQARVTFAADAAATRDLLEKSQPWLSQALGEAGVRLVHTHISAPTDTRGMASQQQQASQGQTPNQHTPNQQQGSNGTELGHPGSQAHQNPGQGQPNWRQAAGQAGLPVSTGAPIDSTRPLATTPATPAPSQRGLHTIV